MRLGNVAWTRVQTNDEGGFVSAASVDGRVVVVTAKSSADACRVVLDVGSGWRLERRFAYETTAYRQGIRLARRINQLRDIPPET